MRLAALGVLVLSASSSAAVRRADIRVRPGLVRAVPAAAAPVDPPAEATASADVRAPEPPRLEGPAVQAPREEPWDARALAPELAVLREALSLRDRAFAETDERMIERLRGFSGAATMAELRGWLRGAGIDDWRAPSHAELDGPQRHRISHSYFFRTRELWPEVDATLKAAIARKAASGERRLVLKSVGGADGQEAYSLAISAERQLLWAGQDPDEWDVTVEAYDFNVHNLFRAARGRYVLDALDGPDVRRAFSLDDDASRYRPSDRLRGWIRPRWIDLTDASQLKRVAESKGDVLIYQHLHYYLPVEVQRRNVEFFRGGSWADGPEALLSYTEGTASVVLAEDDTVHSVARPLSPDPSRREPRVISGR